MLAWTLASLFAAVSAVAITDRAVSTIATVRGPLLELDFPDPAIVQHDGVWYAFASQSIYDNTDIKIQLASSTDYVTWTLHDDYDALPTLPSWAADLGDTWAPDVIQLPVGTWVLYFAATAADNTDHHCVGTATSDSVIGPYVASDTAFACDFAKGGSIDPAGFLDTDGRRYVVWKLDRNSLGHGGTCDNSIAPVLSTPIVVQQVDASDGVTKLGTRVTILHSDPATDGPTLEAPNLRRAADGKLVLFFSNNCYYTDLYAESYAVSSASSPLDGGFVKAPEPLFSKARTDMDGPGGMDVTRDGKNALFHMLQSDGRRFLMSANLTYLPNGYGTGEMEVIA